MKKKQIRLIVICMCFFAVFIALSITAIAIVSGSGSVDLEPMIDYASSAQDQTLEVLKVIDVE